MNVLLYVLLWDFYWFIGDIGYVFLKVYIFGEYIINIVWLYILWNKDGWFDNFKKVCILVGFKCKI